MNDSDACLKSPIIVLGAPRSGTTILASLLARHPHLHYMEEPRLTWRYGNDQKSDMLDAEDARPEVIRHIRAAFARQIREAGKERLLEKTPSNALRGPFIDRVFPDAIYIHIIRNGYESALSIERFWDQHAHGVRHIARGRLRARLREINLRRVPFYAREALRRFAPPSLRRVVGQNFWGPRIPGIDGLLRDLSILDVCCLQWRMCVEAACHFGRSLPAGRYCELHLERLDESRLIDILRFTNLSSESQVLDEFRAQFKPADSRVTGLDPATRDRLALWIEPTTRWLDCCPLSRFG